MGYTEELLIQEIYRNVKEILKRLERLENAQNEETKTQGNIDSNSNS